MSDAQHRHLLPFAKCFLYTADTVLYVIPQIVILTGMDTDHKVRILGGDLYDLPDQGLQIPDIIDLFTDDITADNIRIKDHRLQYLQILPQIVVIRQCRLDK